MLKVLIAIVFFIMIVSLLAGAGFLLSDQSQSKRLLTSLTLRVACAAILMAALVYGFVSGTLA
ncbi:hypothetical protein CHH28_13170 [Bacterioplanes sanyensis]|uniref:DUF2909 domain-containing protein n=1 Tax=Bacterioplanes sanyensis TaxID=1249553 RepID=A0A222FKM9_9GAMM|nr:DUF2909 family protein [Bacterioplanes sanyensis]ASP39568.1 hypothetical protein CHH28_13170 [Bacterioplanes sanyensis]